MLPRSAVPLPNSKQRSGVGLVLREKLLRQLGGLEQYLL
jgi:hypothetical protein